MRKLIQWALWIIVAVLMVKLGMWAYQGFKTGDTGQQQQEVAEPDILCRMYADSGQCICRHRKTGERLSISYDECVSRARK